MPDRAMIERHLAQAEGHVADGERHIARQREIVAVLEHDGHDVAAAQARGVLVQFERLQVHHVEDRDRLREQLAQLDQS